MKVIDTITLILVIVGALNWGSIGLFGFDCVAFLCGGQMAVLSRVIYSLGCLRRHTFCQQRRKSRADTKFRPRPTDTLLADGKGSQETMRFLAHLWVLSVRTEGTPPEAWTSRFYLQFPPKKNRTAVGIGHYKSFG